MLDGQTQTDSSGGWMTFSGRVPRLIEQVLGFHGRPAGCRVMGGHLQGLS